MGLGTETLGMDVQAAAPTSKGPATPGAFALTRPRLNFFLHFPKCMGCICVHDAGLRVASTTQTNLGNTIATGKRKRAR